MIWLHSLVESLRTCVWFVSLTCLCCYSYFCSYCISVLVVSVNCDVVMLMFRHAAQGLTQQYFLPPSFQLAVFVFSVCGGGVWVCVCLVVFPQLTLSFVWSSLLFTWCHLPHTPIHTPGHAEHAVCVAQSVTPTRWILRAYTGCFANPKMFCV